MATTRRAGRVVAVAVLVAGLAGCARGADVAASPDTPPVVLTPVDGSDLKEVTLSRQAVSRLGIRTAPVRPAGTAGHSAIPYSAVIYDEQGRAWAYVAATPLTFVRHAVTVTDITGDVADLSDGPELGTQVVTTGPQELLGAEYEISGE